MPANHPPPPPPPAPAPDADVLIIGAGAAGLMAAIWAARSRPQPRVILLDGARKLGAKILVAGGGRCNVTHHAVSEADFAGSSPPAIRKVLRRFDVAATIAFFQELGVTLKQEDTGKLFPTTDQAATVLRALVEAARQAGVSLRHPWRVEQVNRRADGGFTVQGSPGTLSARRLVLATGGLSLPKSGSDGAGYRFATSLGHRLTPDLFPALVPLVLPGDHFLRALSGLAAPATLSVRSGTGKVLQQATDPVLCTHFGLSGPAVLDISRHLHAAKLADPGAHLTVNWRPDLGGRSFEDEILAQPRASALQLLRAAGLPDRLARALLEAAGLPVGASGPASQLPRPLRRAIVQRVSADPLPVSGDRGFTFAEVTAGGVPLAELNLNTLESRVCPGLFLCGEICDVDGRIGGFNFQWAWASGRVAGSAAAAVAVSS